MLLLQSKSPAANRFWRNPRFSVDPLTSAFAAASGATDLGGIDAIIKYVRSQGLLSNFRLYPMKSAQNAGSGSTVYGIGSLTTGNGTLHNGPTWGVNGIDYVAAPKHYMSIPDFLGTETLTAFSRVDKTDQITVDSFIWGQWEVSSGKRSRAFVQRGTAVGDPLALLRSSNGSSASSNLEIYNDAKSGIGVDTCYVSQWIDGGGRSLWENKSSLSLTLDFGNSQTASFNSNTNITIAAGLTGAGGAPGSFSTLSATAQAWVTGVLTTQQRETLTDLINEL